MEERKRRRRFSGSKEEFENRLFPWMCLVSLILGMVYLCLGIFVNAWLLLFIPLGLLGLALVGCVLLGVAAGLTSMIIGIRDLLEE